MLEKPIKCPKCYQSPTGYDEIWAGHWIQFGADASGAPSAKGELMEGQPVGVKAVCGCGHVWRLRGVTCVTDLRNR